MKRTGHVVKFGRFFHIFVPTSSYHNLMASRVALRNVTRDFFVPFSDLAVFRRFTGLSPVGWYKLSSATRKCLKSKKREK